MRIHYAWNSTNNSPYVSLYGRTRACSRGRASISTSTLQHNFYKTLWAGITGYCMWQLDNDDLENTALAGTPLAEALVQKEQVYSVGPILSLTPLKNLLISWASVWEMGAKTGRKGSK